MVSKSLQECNVDFHRDGLLVMQARFVNALSTPQEKVEVREENIDLKQKNVFCTLKYSYRMAYRIFAVRFGRQFVTKS